MLDNYSAKSKLKSQPKELEWKEKLLQAMIKINGNRIMRKHFDKTNKNDLLNASILYLDFFFNFFYLFLLHWPVKLSSALGFVIWSEPGQAFI